MTHTSQEAELGKKKTSKKPRPQKERIQPHHLPPPVRKGNFDEVNLGYLSFEEILKEANRCLQCGKPKCVEGCPAAFDAKAFIGAIQNQNWDEAVDILYGTYCFPRSLDRICPRFCEQKCVMGRKGDPIQIMHLKRYIADHFDLPNDFLEHSERTGRKVAIVGSGPAGLTAAYYLNKLGHTVTIFEKTHTLGGMMTLGIPEYRLPHTIFDVEIDNLKKSGVRFVTNRGVCVQEGFCLTYLLTHGFDAILLAHGAHKPKWMGLAGELELAGSMHAVPFLRTVNLELKRTGWKETWSGKKVAVIGGGDTAIDAVRVASRLGAYAQIFYRRSLEEMPADPVELAETQREGISINFLVTPVKIISHNGAVTGMRMVRMELGEPDSSGRRRPIPVQGSEFEVEVDMIIQAIGQEPDVENFPEDFQVSGWNTFKVDRRTQETNMPGVFAAGDVASGPLTAVAAIADAHRAVKAIHNWLTTK